jgi:hypothetical protein
MKELPLIMSNMATIRKVAMAGNDDDDTDNISIDVYCIITVDDTE